MLISNFVKKAFVFFKYHNYFMLGELILFCKGGRCHIRCLKDGLFKVSILVAHATIAQIPTSTVLPYCLIHCITGINGQYTVTIISTPVGTPVNGSTNSFDYPILSSVTLICMVDPIPSSTIYRWNIGGCYVNNFNERRCFPAGQTTQNVTEDDLLARDAGNITCTATISGVEYTSDLFILRISGISQ